MLPDIEKYLAYLEGGELTRAQKEEMIRTVWGLMEASIDKAFGLHPVQAVCGYERKKRSQSLPQGIDSKKRRIRKQFSLACHMSDKQGERPNHEKADQQ